MDLVHRFVVTPASIADCGCTVADVDLGHDGSGEKKKKKLRGANEALVGKVDAIEVIDGVQRHFIARHQTLDTVFSQSEQQTFFFFS